MTAREPELRRSDITPEHAAKVISVPVAEWPGRCHEIAGLILTAELVEGTLRYGTWLGPIHKDAPKFGGRRMTHHGWVETQPAGHDDPLDDPPCSFCGHCIEEHERGGIRPCKARDCACADYEKKPEQAHVFDPTRWVFENVEPYLFTGEDTEGYYDVAGDAMRMALLRPWPVKGEGHTPRSEKIVYIDLTATDAGPYLDIVSGMHGGPKTLPTHRDGRIKLTISEVSWIANLPLRLLGPFAADVYRALDAADLGGFVPIDNREVVMGDGFYGRKPTIKKAKRKSKR